MFSSVRDLCLLDARSSPSPSCGKQKRLQASPSTSGVEHEHKVVAGKASGSFLKDCHCGCPARAQG